MKDGGPAFPHVAKLVRWHENGHTKEQITEGGMSLRDWFAGMALQGTLANSDATYALVPGTEGFAAAISKAAYALSDAMLAVREAAS